MTNSNACKQQYSGLLTIIIRWLRLDFRLNINDQIFVLARAIA